MSDPSHTTKQDISIQRRIADCATAVEQLSLVTKAEFEALNDLERSHLYNWLEEIATKMDIVCIELDPEEETIEKLTLPETITRFETMIKAINEAMDPLSAEFIDEFSKQIN